MSRQRREATTNSKKAVDELGKVFHSKFGDLSEESISGYKEEAIQIPNLSSMNMDILAGAYYYYVFISQRRLTVPLHEQMLNDIVNRLQISKEISHRELRIKSSLIQYIMHLDTLFRVEE